MAPIVLKMPCGTRAYINDPSIARGFVQAFLATSLSRDAVVQEAPGFSDDVADAVGSPSEFGSARSGPVCFNISTPKADDDQGSSKQLDDQEALGKTIAAEQCETDKDGAAVSVTKLPSAPVELFHAEGLREAHQAETMVKMVDEPLPKAATQCKMPERIHVRKQRDLFKRGAKNKNNEGDPPDPSLDLPGRVRFDAASSSFPDGALSLETLVPRPVSSSSNTGGFGDDGLQRCQICGHEFVGDTICDPCYYEHVDGGCSSEASSNEDPVARFRRLQRSEKLLNSQHGPT